MTNSFQQLNSRQRIGQLFHVAAWSNKDKKHEDEILDLIESHGIGGLIFFQGTPERQAELCNQYQAAANVPLMISIDGEWGLAMRLDKTMAFPYQMTLGAVQDEDLIEQMGREIGQQCRRLGIHVNFAPTVDINTNAKNPVIGFRAFGEDRVQVTQKALAYMRGMQAANVLTVAKHFPGHGDTALDSHLDMPVILHDRKRLEEIEFYPYPKMIAAGVDAIMVSHIHIPALDDSPNIPATLSRPIVQGLLQEEMGFEGLIFTDALNMKGVAKFYEPGRVDVMALLAGNDVLLYAEDVPKAIEMIEKAVQDGEISQAEIDRRCLKQWDAKRRLGLWEEAPISLQNLHQDLHSPAALALNQKLAAASLCLLKNETDFLPLKQEEKVASVAIYSSDKTVFQKNIPSIDHFNISNKNSTEENESILTQLQAYDKVLLCLHGLQIKAVNRFGITDEMIALISELCSSSNVAVLAFCNAYALNELPIAEAKAVLLSFQESDEAQLAAVEVVAGRAEAVGRMPVSLA